MAYDSEIDEVREDELLIGAFQTFIQAQSFPCVGAKSALSKGQMKVLVARDIRSAWNDLPVHAELHAFAQRYKADPRLFQSFAVLFKGPLDLSEEAFERCMWARIQSLTDKDAWHGVEPDPRVDASPDSPHFSLSFGGEAFFAVGLHPNASRDARRFHTPAIVFNLHDQFERLRADGLYEKLRGAILQRDEALQGSLNPMLARHGEGNEARQYSGRQVDESWRCPMGARTAPAKTLADLQDLLP
jgi:uncharacterized protein